MEHLISVNVADRNIPLLFGMTAVRIWQERALNDVVKPALSADKKKIDPEKVKGSNVDNTKAWAYMVFAGMCNYADYKEIERPQYGEAYELAEEMLYLPDEEQKRIWDCFSNSRAYERMTMKLSELTGKQKKSENSKTTSVRGKK